MYMHTYRNSIPMQESGYTFNIEDQPIIFQSTVALISADNPASSSLGGFKEGATAYRHCRQCMGTYDQTTEEVYCTLLK